MQDKSNLAVLVSVPIISGILLYIGGTVNANQLLLREQQVITISVQKDILLLRTDLAVNRQEQKDMQLYMYSIDKRVIELEASR